MLLLLWRQRRWLGLREPPRLGYFCRNRGRSRRRVRRYTLRCACRRVERIVPTQKGGRAAAGAYCRRRASRSSALLEVLELLVKGFVQSAEGVCLGLLVRGRLVCLTMLVLLLVLRVIGAKLSIEERKEEDTASSQKSRSPGEAAGENWADKRSQGETKVGGEAPSSSRERKA